MLGPRYRPLPRDGSETQDPVPRGLPVRSSGSLDKHPGSRAPSPHPELRAGSRGPVRRTSSVALETLHLQFWSFLPPCTRLPRKTLRMQGRLRVWESLILDSGPSHPTRSLVRGPVCSSRVTGPLQSAPRRSRWRVRYLSSGLNRRAGRAFSDDGPSGPRRCWRRAAEFNGKQRGTAGQRDAEGAPC